MTNNEDERPSPELVLTTTLLSLHEAGMGRLLRAVSCSTATIRMLQDLGLHEGTVHDSPGAFRGASAELVRLVCLSYVTELTVSCLAGKPAAIGETDFMIASSRLAYVASDSTTAAFLALLRAAQVFAGVVDYHRRISARLDFNVHEAHRACQDSLAAWAESLHPSLAFNDENLSAADRLQSQSASPSLSSGSGSERAAWGWAWSMMHCFAEMTVCLLEISANTTAHRRSAACTNLAILLDTMDKDNRASVLAVLPLLFAAQAPGDASLRVSSYLAAARDSSQLTDSQLRRTMSFLGMTPVSSPTPTPVYSSRSPQVSRAGAVPPAADGAYPRHPSSLPPLAPYPSHSHAHSRTHSRSYSGMGDASTSPSGYRHAGPTLPPLGSSPFEHHRGDSRDAHSHHSHQHGGRPHLPTLQPRSPPGGHERLPSLAAMPSGSVGPVSASSPSPHLHHLPHHRSASRAGGLSLYSSGSGGKRSYADTDDRKDRILPPPLGLTPGGAGGGVGAGQGVGGGRVSPRPREVW